MFFGLTSPCTRAIRVVRRLVDDRGERLARLGHGRGRAQQVRLDAQRLEEVLVVESRGEPGGARGGRVDAAEVGADAAPANAASTCPASSSVFQLRYCAGSRYSSAIANVSVVIAEHARARAGDGRRRRSRARPPRTRRGRSAPASRRRPSASLGVASARWRRSSVRISQMSEETPPDSGSAETSSTTPIRPMSRDEADRGRPALPVGIGRDRRRAHPRLGHDRAEGCPYADCSRPRM